jgi:hypothetical protein
MVEWGIIYQNPSQGPIKRRLLAYTVVLVLNTLGRGTHHLGIRNKRWTNIQVPVLYIHATTLGSPIIFGSSYAYLIISFAFCKSMSY